MPTKNLVSNYSAVADGQWSEQAFTLTAGTKLLASPVDLWDAGDVGKQITVGGAGGGSGPHFSTIFSVTDARNIVLADNGITTIPGGGRTKYIVAWGTSNDGALQDFKDENDGLTVTLDIDPGTYFVSSGNFNGLFGGGENPTWVSTPLNCTVNATGATICGNTYHLGAGQEFNIPNITARVASVNAGATSVAALTPAQASRFTVGDWALMTGASTQFGGYPTNHSFYDWVLISGVNTSTGVISFATTPLTFSYKATWPVYNDGGGVSLDEGGAATLYAWSPDFNHTLVVNGLTIAHDSQWAVCGLDIVLNDCVFEGTANAGPAPTQARSVMLNGCTGLTCAMEVDKYLKTLTLNDCNWSGIALQSDISNLILDGTTVTDSVVGSAKNFVIRNGCDINSMQAGAAYGVSETLVVSDSIISAFSAPGVQTAGGDGSAAGVQNDFTMTAGVLFIPSEFYPFTGVCQFSVKGQYLFWEDLNIGNFGGFNVLDVTQDGTGIYLHTDWTGSGGGFPVRAFFGGKLYMRRHPAKSCTFTNVMGCAEVVDLSGAPAGSPINSYTKRSYTGSIAVGDYIALYGKIKRITIRVPTQYTGPTGTVNASVQFLGTVKMSDSSDVSFNPIINLKTAGTRSLDCTGGYPAAWTGGQTGDTLPTVTEDWWLCGAHHMSMTDVSGESSGGWPAFSIEIETDQGVLVSDESDVVVPDPYARVLMAQACM